MKTLIRSLLALLVLAVVTVAEGSLSAAVPISLPIGKNFLSGKGVSTVTVSWGNVRTGEVLGATQLSYDSSMGNLELFMGNELRKLTTSFVPVQGTETDEYTVQTDARQWFGKKRAPIAFGDGKYFHLENRDGFWVIPESVLNVKLVYWNYQPFLVPGLKWVSTAQFVDSTVYESPNGAPPGCSLAPDGGNYLGSDVLILPETYIRPESWATGEKLGTVTLYFSEEKSVWGKYSLEDGSLLAKSEEVGVSLAIKAVDAPKARVAPSSISEGKMLLTATPPAGASGSIVIECASSLEGPWQVIATLPVTGGPVTTTDPAKAPSQFYRAHLVP